MDYGRDVHLETQLLARNLNRECRENGIDGTIAVQADPSPLPG